MRPSQNRSGEVCPNQSFAGDHDGTPADCHGGDVGSVTPHASATTDKHREQPFGRSLFICQKLCYAQLCFHKK